MNEKEVREHVRKLRRFYTDVVIYLAVNAFLILVWALSGVGYFWPIWVIIGWGIGLGLHALSLGLIPQMTSMLPFMTAEWEDEEVRRLMDERETNGSGSSSQDVKSTPQTTAVRKTSTRKTTAKKTTKK